MISLDVIKALAILLVTHSHMKDFYPIPQLATGGLLGNTLFFFASSYAITLSLERRRVAFVPWFLRRAWRIYAPLWLTVALLLPLGVFPVIDLRSALALFFVPQQYWFLPTIVLLYVPCYFVITRVRPVSVQLVAALVLLVYALASLTIVDPAAWNVEDSVPLKSIFYFAVMLLGIHACETRHQLAAPRSGALRTLALTLAFFAYLYLLRRTGFFIVQAGANFLALAWVLSLFHTLNHPSVARVIDRWGRGPVVFLSVLTLHIYLVQVPLVDDAGLEILPFPVNVAIFWIGLILLAWLLSQLTRAVVARIERVASIGSGRPAE